MKLEIDVPVCPVAAVRAYLTRTGWRDTTHPVVAFRGTWQYWERGDQEGVEIPLREDAADFDRWMGRAVVDIARVLGRPEKAVYDEIMEGAA